MNRQHSSHFRQVESAPFTLTSDGLKVLQCHSRGDIRFSPFGWRVIAFSQTRTIEDHYQSAKVFDGERIPRDWREAKELKRARVRQVAWQIGALRLPTRQSADGAFALNDFGIQWYCLLWARYIRPHPELIEHARGFDLFHDPFASNFPFSQAKVWELVAKHADGLERLEAMGAELYALLEAEWLKRR
jgi:hypothetical protein